jgi:DNA-binding NarL/FixJ family response regulator
VDLLVTDQNMPGMSGVQVARAVAQCRSGLRVAVVSGHVNDALLADAAAAGVVQVLAKQNSVDALGEALQALLKPPQR